MRGWWSRDQQSIKIREIKRNFFCDYENLECTACSVWAKQSNVLVVDSEVWCLRISVSILSCPAVYSVELVERMKKRCLKCRGSLYLVATVARFGAKSRLLYSFLFFNLPFVTLESKWPRAAEKNRISSRGRDTETQKPSYKTQNESI